MTSLGIIRALGVVAGAIALFMLAWGWAARQRRRRIARAPGRAAPGFAEPEAAHRLELRLAALERGQADLAGRLEGAGGAEERLQATAGQLLGLVRDKNATIETALAGLDQLRNRMRVLEQIGDAAEARGLFERLGERLGALESAGAAAAARGDDGAAQAALLEQLTRLHAQKDAATEAVLGRLAPVEARLSRLEGEAPGEALARLEARLEALRDAQGAAQAALAAHRAETAAAAAAATAPATEIAERLARLQSQQDAAFERLAGRLAALEADHAARDPAPALDALGIRLEALRERVGLLEAPEESPFAAVSEQLTRLYAQKDAATEAVLARLAPVEARLEALGREVTAADPAVGRLEEMVEAVRLAQAGVAGRLAAVEAMPEAVIARLAPVEARLEELGREVAAADPAVGAARGGGRGAAGCPGGARCRARGAGGGAGVAGREPVRGDLRAADAALRAEGRGDRGGAGAAGAGGGAAGRARARGCGGGSGGGAACGGARRDPPGAGGARPGGSRRSSRRRRARSRRCRSS